MLKNPTSVYQFPAANANAIFKHMNDMYNSGTPASHGGRVVSTYYLIGNNCATVTSIALQKGGVKYPTLQMPADFNFWQHPERAMRPPVF